MKPISPETLQAEMKAMNIPNIASATIRQILTLATRLEPHLGEKFVHLEMGNPGLPASEVGIEAEREALTTASPTNIPTSPE